jgi:hypothetical protein
MKPEATVMEPDLESQDPMDPVPGQVEPPPGSMEPLPPPNRGADRPPDPVSTLMGAPGSQFEIPGAMNEALGVTLYGVPPVGRKSLDESRLVQVVLTHGLDRDEVKSVLQAHRHETHHCYKKGLMQDPRLAGTVRVSFIINKTGRPQDCRVEENLSVAEVGSCLCTRLMTWKFPEPTSGVAKVSATWSFNPQTD